MGFDVILMSNSSETNKIGKSLTTISTINGVLKDGCSIIDPVILIDYDMSALVNANYCHVGTFGRYYFIQDIVSVRSAVCELHCHVDVLESFKTQILANEAIVQRQERQWNLYINDGLFNIYQNPYIQIKETAQSFDNINYSRVLVLTG